MYHLYEDGITAGYVAAPQTRLVSHKVSHGTYKVVLASARVALAGALLTYGAGAAHGQVDSHETAAARSVVISADAPGNPHVEPFLALNPRNGANLLVTSTAVNEQGTLGSALYMSEDEGHGWSRVHLQKDAEPVAEGGDAVVYFDPAGAAYFATIGRGGFRLTHSSDGGRTWAPMTVVFGGLIDRQYLAFARSDGKFAGRIYAVGTAYVIRDVDGGALRRAILFCYSTDGGATFSAPAMLVASAATENIGILGDPIVTPDDKVIVPFETKSDADDVNRRVRVIVSEDGGASWSRPYDVARVHHATGYRYLQGMGVIRGAVDTSKAATRGRVYLAWSTFDGDKYDVECVYSDDGERWSSPTKVNDNTNPVDQANPAIAVNQDGIVALIWNDRRDTPRNDCFRLYGAYSVDGGASFLPNFTTGDGMTCPNAPGNWVAEAFSSHSPGVRTGEMHRHVDILTVASRWPNGGETQGLVATPGGDFAAAVVNGTSGVMQLWFERLARDTLTKYQAAPEDRSLDTDPDLRVNVHHAMFDMGRHRMSIDVDIENVSGQAVRGPLALVVASLQSGMKGVRIVNADNGYSGVGAEWRFNAPGQARSLAAHAHTTTRTIELAFAEFVPDSRIDPAELDLRIARKP